MNTEERRSRLLSYIQESPAPVSGARLAAVNDELGALEASLEQVLEMLNTAL